MTAQPIATWGPHDVEFVADDLSDLSEDPTDWQVWRWGEQRAFVRRNGTDPTRYVAVIPFIYTHAIIVGSIARAQFGHQDRWCYHTPIEALAAATRWDGAEGTEPEGWHRHPYSGRRRNPDGTIEVRH
jgi:hypothetical protein